MRHGGHRRALPDPHVHMRIAASEAARTSSKPPDTYLSRLRTLVGQRVYCTRLELISTVLHCTVLTCVQGASVSLGKPVARQADGSGGEVGTARARTTIVLQRAPQTRPPRNAYRAGAHVASWRKVAHAGLSQRESRAAAAPKRRRIPRRSLGVQRSRTSAARAVGPLSRRQLSSAILWCRDDSSQWSAEVE